VGVYDPFQSPEDRVNYSISFNADTPPEIGLVKNLGSINCSDQSARGCVDGRQGVYTASGCSSQKHGQTESRNLRPDLARHDHDGAQIPAQSGQFARGPADRADCTKL